MRGGSVQRRRGRIAVIYRSELIEDRRGNKQRQAVEENPHRVRALQIPDRSARAELPGQQQINVVHILVPADLDGVDIYSRVEWDGKTWDIPAPPQHHEGTKHTKHWSIPLRERPS